MKLSLNWLQDFVTLTEKNPQTIADRLTESVAEVEHVDVQGTLLENCCVGKLLSMTKHPHADRLNLCDVKTDKGMKRVVCGGTNLRDGMRVAFAHVGARVRCDGKVTLLNKATIRGEESNGMICSAHELDLSEKFPPRAGTGTHPVVDLGDGDAGVGTDLREFLGLTDTIFHVDNHAITHRPDLFSQVGFARECVALGLAKWKKKPVIREIKGPKTKTPFGLKNDVGNLIPYYEACLLSMGATAPTPEWMKRRLEATGWRSINLVVDVTNYVLMETGMPLHAFDAADFRGTLRIRKAEQGEKITTLDRSTRPLPIGAVIISDDEGIFDLFGVMGGLRTSNKPSTRSIFLQAGIIDAVSVRRTTIAMGHRTDAATVYEKSVTPSTSHAGLARAVDLLLTLCPGTTIAAAPVVWGKIVPHKSISLTIGQAESVLGLPLKEKSVMTILSDLDCTIKKKPGTRNSQPATLLVTPPLHRRDLKEERDLIEEIGRIVGYNAIPPRMPEADIDPPARLTMVNDLRGILAECGYTELLPLTLTSQKSLESAGAATANAVRIRNPLGEELGLLQTSTVPALLEHAQRNILNARGAIRSFHWGHVFEKGPRERLELSLLLAPLTDVSDMQQEPVLVLKADVLDTLNRCGFDCTLGSADAVGQAMHPGRVASVMLGKDTVGIVFELHPTISKRYGLRGRSAVATIDLALFLTKQPRAQIARPLPAFPEIRYDVTTTLDDRKKVVSILATLHGTDPLLAGVEVVYLFRGKNLGAHEYNLTLRCTYRAADRTLTDQEAQGAHGKVIETLKKGGGKVLD